MKKVIIIGAGISGLASGIYALKNGFDAEIYEMHSIAGGECTGWNRGKYHFDGCIHWLMGSKKGTSLNKLWREVGALDDSVAMINSEHFGQFEINGRTLTLYRDADRLEKHLLELSPGDKKAIKKLCMTIRGLKQMEIPFAKPYDMMKKGDMVKMMLKMMPFTPYMKYNNMDIAEYADRFQDELIRTALTEAMGSKHSALALLSTLASLANGDSGWPEGGSRKFAQRMQGKFEALGGKIHFKSPVERIIVEDGTAKGIVLADGSRVFGDAIISTTDGYEALFTLLDGKYLSEVHRKMYTVNDDAPVNTSFQVWVGIATDLSRESLSISFELPEPVEMGGKIQRRIGIKNYSFDKKMVPKGHGVLSSIYMVENFDWWKDLYADKERYKKEKEHIANVVKEAIEMRFPRTRGKIEHINVATPMTYVRYCNAWRGAWMSWITTPRLKVRSLPMKLEGLSSFIMGGQWIMPPGGLPTALITGRWTIQHLCAAENRRFVSE